MGIVTTVGIVPPSTGTHGPTAPGPGEDQSQSASEVTASAFHNAPIAALIIDLASEGGCAVRGVNQALCDLTGRRHEELMSAAPSEVIVGLGDLAAVLAEGTGVVGVEAHCVHASGRRTAVTLHSAPLEGSPASASVVIVQIYEVTRRQQLERALRESETRVQDLVDNVNALIYIKRADGRFILINRHFEELFGVSREEALDRTNYDLFPTPIAAVHTANDRRVLETGVAMNFEEPRSDGGAWLSLKFPLFDQDGRPYAVGGISTDITPRRRAEAAIRHAKDEAERANRAKTEFLSRMSHELRTPLNSILGFGQLVQMEQLPPSAGECVDRIVNAGRHLLALINEALDISRIEAGAQALSLEPVHACDPLTEALDLVGPLAREREIEIVRDFHGGLYQFVLADYQRLKQVLLNVLTNAVKYNRARGHVHISFRAAQPGQLRLCIADTGYGIPPEDIEKVFVPFERLGADRTEIEGTGLGLALSRTLVEAMGGTIGIERSVVGRGTTFFIELALTDRDIEPDFLRRQPDAAPPAMSVNSGTVLYIEDNLSNLDLVQRLFTRVGNVTLIPAMQGQLGIELATRHRPELILLDLHLPDIDGDEVLERLQRDERTKRIPVIVLSADATPAHVKRLKERGVEDYLTKPIDVPEFLEAIRRAIARPPS